MLRYATALDMPSAALNQPLEDVWVELPEPVEKPARSRRGRGKSRVEALEPPTDPAPMEAYAQPEVQPDAEPAAPPVVVEATPEPRLELALVAEALPTVLAEALPDPAEISAPPTAPKKGWWRRGA